MTTYRYINANHSLVLRDDRVIAWDATADCPSNNQHGDPDNELQIWKAAGSPQPTSMRAPPPTEPYQPYKYAMILPPPLRPVPRQGADEPDEVAELRRRVEQLERALRQSGSTT